MKNLILMNFSGSVTETLCSFFFLINFLPLVGVVTHQIRTALEREIYLCSFKGQCCMWIYLSLSGITPVLLAVGM